MGDTDGDIDTAEIEAECWIEHMKRSTGIADEKMRIASILCWIETHKDEVEIGNEDHFTQRQHGQKKAAKWNPGLSIRCKASRAVARPRKR